MILKLKKKLNELEVSDLTTIGELENILELFIEDIDYENKNIDPAKRLHYAGALIIINIDRGINGKSFLEYINKKNRRSDMTINKFLKIYHEFGKYNFPSKELKDFKQYVIEKTNYIIKRKL